MAHGTPVVTSLGTSTEEVAGGAALLVDPRDEVALALDSLKQARVEALVHAPRAEDHRAHRHDLDVDQ